jgi:hypothetical protein
MKILYEISPLRCNGCSVCYMLYHSDMLHYVRTACLRHMLCIIYRINRKYSPKQLLLVCARCEVGIVTKKGPAVECDSFIS